MKKRGFIALLLTVIVLLGLLSGCQTESPDAGESQGNTPASEGDKPLIEKIDNLSEDFIFGMDASCVPALENSGVKYYGFDGQEQDVFKILADNGINYIRVRVWNNPYDAEGNGYGGGNCDIQNALAIGKRATQYGMKLLVNFHYSDFWADPNKQMAPLAWKDMNVEEKAQALYAYTKESLQLLKDAGIDVGMVQVGNETTGKMCGESSWDNICTLMRAGSDAVREVFPDAQVAVHFTNPEKSGNYRYYAQQLAKYQVDYDVFASSYYPYWHGSVWNLSNVLTEISGDFHKKVMVVETSYAYTDQDSDYSGNTISATSQVAKKYSYSVEGQMKAIRDVVKTVAAVPGSIGVFYWEGTWITVGQTSWEENSQKWETYGSGWASSYAKAYDPVDAGKWYGGCAVDNQALFDANGKPLESLKVFSMLRGE